MEYQQWGQREQCRVVGAVSRGPSRRPGDYQSAGAEQQRGEQAEDHQFGPGLVERVFPAGQLTGRPHERAGEHRVLHGCVAVGERTDVEALVAPERDDVGITHVRVLLVTGPVPVGARCLLQVPEQQREAGEGEQHPDRRPPAAGDGVPAPGTADASGRAVGRVVGVARQPSGVGDRSVSGGRTGGGHRVILSPGV